MVCPGKGIRKEKLEIIIVVVVVVAVITITYRRRSSIELRGTVFGCSRCATSLVERIRVCRSRHDNLVVVLE